MLTSRKIAWAAFSGTLLGVFASCAPVSETDPSANSEHIGETSEAVVNGTAFYSDRDVKLTDNHSGCSGTLLNPNWILTAAHCNFDNDFNSGSTITITDSYGATAIADRIVRHFSLDLAMVHTPTAMRGSTYKAFLYTGSSTHFNGTAYPTTVEGYGDNNCSGTGFGALRYAPMHATSTSFPGPPTAPQLYVTWYPNVAGNTAASGDSGGGLFLHYVAGTYYQNGVVKAGACGIESYAAAPEIFEKWAFQVMYNTPINVPTVDSNGLGLWTIAGSPSYFWTRPLANNAHASTAPIPPCPGYSGTYKVTSDYVLYDGNGDFIAHHSNSGTSYLSGTSYVSDGGRELYYGSGSFSLEYQTDGSHQSPGINWMTVQCGYNASDPADLVCHGSRCQTTRDPIQNNFSKSLTWDPCVGQGFAYYLDYEMEQSYDYVHVGPYSYTGRGNASNHVSGPVTLSVTSDASVQSAGIRSLYAVCDGW